MVGALRYSGFRRVVRRVDRDVHQDQQCGEVVPRPLVEPPLEELRHREHAGLQVERQEEDQEHDEDQRGHPFVVVDGDSRTEGGGRQPDEGAGRDVRREQGKTDEPPGERATGKEVVVGGLRPPGEVEPESDDEHDVEQHHQQIGSRELKERFGRDRATRGAGLEHLHMVEPAGHRLPGLRQQIPRQGRAVGTQDAAHRAVRFENPQRRTCRHVAEEDTPLSRAGTHDQLDRVRPPAPHGQRRQRRSEGPHADHGTSDGADLDERGECLT